MNYLGNKWNDRERKNKSRAARSATRLILIRTPSRSPINHPDKIDDPRGHNHNASADNRMLILPEKVCEGEQGQIVVRPLKTCKTCYHDYCQEELLHVL
jgi:hypothetical protein